MCADTLLKDIENCRKEMVELAAKTSLSNQRVVDISTKLDHLLNKYYHLTSKKTFLY
ncbi:aspartyl-phosphate phosphatase Spo0E family protein [Mesobacillus jeotgali]|uniref:Aspartyl-phosphate phosphatase Spo0E family protein n=1 Tax=Mesobacillus jeotgali TaxID=129985 RepID=A0ABY9VHI4_9BACI|nr:aspartyl-phosphate phosphatase Spo0E family protein [Mesobacillus jeotgali]WNF23145.1 aspartyl-phosphate phosphatase Spo0E family protein [Mesobacillus jeotgali]